VGAAKKEKKRVLKIAPSILSADFTQLAKRGCGLDPRLVDYLHVDVMDGHFVPNLTIGPPVIEQLKAITEIPLDVHIMISNPLETFEPLCSGRGVSANAACGGLCGCRGRWSSDQGGGDSRRHFDQARNAARGDPAGSRTCR